MLHGITRFNYLVKYKIWKAFSVWEWKLLSIFYFSKHGILVMTLGYRDAVSAVQNDWALNKWLSSVEQPKLWRRRNLHVSLLSVCLSQPSVMMPQLLTSPEHPMTPITTSTTSSLSFLLVFLQVEGEGSCTLHFLLNSTEPKDLLTA